MTKRQLWILVSAPLLVGTGLKILQSSGSSPQAPIRTPAARRYAASNEFRPQAPPRTSGAGNGQVSATGTLASTMAAGPERYGSIQPVKADANDQTASVYQALKAGTPPERLAALLPPQRFEKLKYLSHPEEYLRVVEPGRVFQTAQPGRDVPALVAARQRFHRIQQGGSARLSVQAPPGAPVTFTSFDLGAFQENSLNSVTVRANQAGLASVTFIGTPGTLNDVNILAGSPMASGQVRFVVVVER